MQNGAVLQDRTAIVTGGASGIGRAIVVRFAQAGARVAVLDIDVAGGEVVTRELQDAARSAAYFRCDVTRQAEVFDVFGAVQHRFGGLDILVNSAGIAHIGTIEDTSETDFDLVYTVNVKGVYNCLKAGIAAMKRRGGAILNLASVASTLGIADRFAYSMSKGAVLAMTLSVARDYVTSNIRCNCVAPARVHTPFVDGFLKAAYPGREQEMFERLAQTQPIGRMGRPEEVAELATFLCSDAAAFITGSNYAIDGGFATLKM